MFDLRSSASDAVTPTRYLPARAHLSHDPSARRVPHSAESNKDTTASEGRIITTLKSGVEQAHTPALCGERSRKPWTESGSRWQNWDSSVVDKFRYNLNRHTFKVAFTAQVLPNRLVRHLRQVGNTRTCFGACVKFLERTQSTVSVPAACSGWQHLQRHSDTQGRIILDSGSTVCSWLGWGYSCLSTHALVFWKLL